MNRLSKLFFVFLFNLVFLVKFSRNAEALTSAKNTISTSRPSASGILAVGASAGVTEITLFDNGSIFLASDSAKMIGGTLENATVASMSATDFPSAGQRKIYLTSATTQSHDIGSSVFVPITASHVISFRNDQAIPNDGKIQIFFPIGNTSNPDQPSSAGFSFNNLSSSTGPTAPNVSVTGITCSSYVATAATGLFQCNLGAALTGPTTITVRVGSTSPILINPTKTTTAGTADVWTVIVKTIDDSDNDIETSKIKIGTIDSVQVYATVDPTLSFTIAGLSNGAAVNVGNSVGCTNTETINTGFNSSATEVNLGTLATNQINISAQLMTISTNGSFGYTLTATSSGHLADPDNGYWLADAQGTPTNNDTPAPEFFTAGSTAYGIHACGADVTGGTWGTGTTGGGANAKYANPSPSYYYTLASQSSGPIDGTVIGHGLTTVQYAATVSSVVPAGLYKTVMTYVATPIF